MLDAVLVWLCGRNCCSQRRSLGQLTAKALFLFGFDPDVARSKPRT